MKLTRTFGLFLLLVMVGFLVAQVVQAAPTRTGYRLTRGPGQDLTPPGGYAGQLIGLTPPGFETVRAPRKIVEVLRAALPAPPAPAPAGLGAGPDQVPVYDSDLDPMSPDYLLSL